MKGQPYRSATATTDAGLRIEENFCRGAKDLRTQFDDVVLNSAINSGMTPFTYAFCDNVYQFLTASGERIFRQDSIEDLVSRVRSWAANTLQVSQTTTPQVRVYIGGCRRMFAPDNVGQPWHYMLGLSAEGAEKMGGLRVLREESTRGKTVGGEIVNVKLKFNQLLVHRTAYPYSIETSTLSMNPSDGLVFLDGYLW